MAPFAAGKDLVGNLLDRDQAAAHFMCYCTDGA